MKHFRNAFIAAIGWGFGTEIWNLLLIFAESLYGTIKSPPRNGETYEQYRSRRNKERKSNTQDMEKQFRVVGFARD